MITAHSEFRLFATQNPSGGAYGGRKQLSDAFKNRFLQLVVPQFPEKDLLEILDKRSGLAPKYAKLMLEVMNSLRSLRLGGGSVFAAKQSVITVRDLMKWAARVASKTVPDEMKKEIALQGYILFGERVRTQD